jgi:hypothetical protein
MLTRWRFRLSRDGFGFNPILWLLLSRTAPGAGPRSVQILCRLVPERVHEVTIHFKFLNKESLIKRGLEIDTSRLCREFSRKKVDRVVAHRTCIERKLPVWGTRLREWTRGRHKYIHQS